MCELLKCNFDVKTLQIIDSLYLEMNRRISGKTDLENFRNGVDQFLKLFFFELRLTKNLDNLSGWKKNWMRKR